MIHLYLMSLKFNQRPPSSEKFVRAKTKKVNSKNIFALLSLLLIVGGLTAGYFLTQKQQDIRQQASTAKYDNLPDYSEPENIDADFLANDTIVATVGEESIYQSDIDVILAILPPFSDKNRPAIIKEIIDDFIEDSILLQEYQQTDIEIFSSPFKNYAKRAKVVGQLIEQKKTELKQNMPYKQGSVLTIWTTNDEILPDAELSRRRKIIKPKIDKLYEQVKNGELTIQAAGKAIQDDSSLVEFDDNYVGNAIIPFEVICFPGGECEGYNDHFVKELGALNNKEISQLKLHTSPNKAEEFYTFGQVTSVNQGTSYQTYFE